MEYKHLGNHGIKISSIGLGAQTFGWNIDEKSSHELLSLYYHEGGNFIDTSDSYNEGRSEEILGSWIRKNADRNNLIIGTKVFFPTASGPNNEGLSRKHIFQSVNESLKRLQTDYIDIYQIHCFDKMTPLEETLQALDDLVRMGKVLYPGVSNITPSQLMKALMLGERNGRSPLILLQLEYSLLVRSPEWELLPLCKENGLGCLAWSPLAGGWLTGKYGRNKSLPAGSRVAKGERWDDSLQQRGTETAYTIIDELEKISGETGKPVSQISLNWLIQGGNVTAPLIGARTREQLIMNLRALDWTLSMEHMARLDRVSRIPEPYPYNFINRYTRSGETMQV